MNTRAAACTALLALAALTAGCSSSSDDKPTQPATTTAATPTVDTAAARKACVDAWAELIDTTDDAGMDDEPTECAGLPEDDALDRYMDGLQQRNQAARDAFDQDTDEGVTQP